MRLQLERASSNVIVTDSAEPELAETAPDLVDVITRPDIDHRQQIWLTDMLASRARRHVFAAGPLRRHHVILSRWRRLGLHQGAVDGTPVNEPGGAIDFSNFTTDDIDKIEIVHGASSALYGSDAMDGVIQIFTHRGTTTTPQITLEGDGGTFGTGHGSGQLSGMLGKFDYSASAGYFSTDGQGPGTSTGTATASGNFGWKFSNTDSLRLTLRNNSSDAGAAGPNLAAGRCDHRTDQRYPRFPANLAWNFSTGEHWQTRYPRLSRASFWWKTRLSSELSPRITTAPEPSTSPPTVQNGSFTAGYENEVETGPSAEPPQSGWLHRSCAISSARV